MHLLKEKLAHIKNRFTALSLKKKIAVIVVLLLVVFFLVKALQPKKEDYQTGTVTRGTVSDIITETGNVQAAAAFDVYSPTTGFIEEVYVKNGQEVKEGDKLFKAKSTASQQEKADALTNYLLAQSTLGNAQATMYSLQSTMYSNWDTFQQLATNSTYQNSDGSAKSDSRNLPEFTTAQADWLASEAQFKNQKSVVSQAQAGLASGKLKYDATQNATITAPTTGTIANLTARTGELVKAKDNSGTANTPELIIGDFSHNLIKIELNEVDVNKVKVRQNVELVFDAARNKTYSGDIVNVDDVGKNENGVITYNTYVSINKSDKLIKPGMTVTVSINTDTQQNVLLVPNSAIKPYQGGKAVLVPGKKGNSKLPYYYMPVKTGIKGVTHTQIISGLTQGQKIILSTATPAKIGQ